MKILRAQKFLSIDDNNKKECIALDPQSALHKHNDTILSNPLHTESIECGHLNEELLNRSTAQTENSFRESASILARSYRWLLSSKKCLREFKKQAEDDLSLQAGTVSVNQWNELMSGRGTDCPSWCHQTTDNGKYITSEWRHTTTIVSRYVLKVCGTS